MADKEVTIGQVFDSVSETSSYQLWVCFLCFLITTLDGFDMIIIGVATPKIAEFLHVSMKDLGLAWASSLLGPFSAPCSSACLQTESAENGC